jgi:hypothetical protein
MPIERVEQALMRAVQRLRFFPKPVEILDLSGESQASLADVALVESSKAITALEKHGTYASVCFDNPVTQAVIERHFGGWPEFSQAVRDDGAKWVGKDFCRVYEAFSRQNVQVTGYLPGICERENSLSGCERFTARPALIGDRQKALAVLGESRKEALPAGPREAREIVHGTIGKVLEFAQARRT